MKGSFNSLRKDVIINRFVEFGVERKSLIRTTLRAKGSDWMQKLIDLAIQKAECGILRSVTGFVVNALQHPDEVTFDASGSAASKKKRKKKKSPGHDLSNGYLNGDHSYNGNGTGNGHRKKRKKYRSPVAVREKLESGRRDDWDYDPLAGQRQGERWD